MNTFFELLNEDISDYGQGLLESEISYQNIVMESMNSEMNILINEEADSDNKQQSIVVNFFQKILEWFKELGKKIGRFIQDVLKKAKQYYIKAYNWFKVKMKTMTHLTKNEKIRFRTLYKWKNGVFPDVSDIAVIITKTDVDSIESIVKATDTLANFYEDKKIGSDVETHYIIEMIETNIKRGPGLITYMQESTKELQDEIDLIQTDIKRAIANAKNEKNFLKLKENKDKFAASKKLMSARNNYLSRCVSVINDVIKDSIKVAKTINENNTEAE